MKCFISYFAPLFFYIRNVFQLSINDLVLVGSLVVSSSTAVASYFLEINYFGVSNLLILIVLSTIAANTIFGILKSQKKSRQALLKAQKHKTGPEFRLQMKLHQRYKFDYRKLQFVFFKALTFLTYLMVASTFLSEGEGFLDWTSAVIIQTPVAILWYVEWKSIGENSEYYFDKKAPIFEVTEWIFEAKFFSKFFNKETPKPEI